MEPMRRRAFLLVAATGVVSACGEESYTIPDSIGGVDLEWEDASPSPEPTAETESDEMADDTVDTAGDVDPSDYPQTAEQWGETVTGVRTRLATDDRVVALTFDACGGPNGIAYDEQLIDFLVAEEIPATLFLNQRWINANEDVVVQLADNPLFELANHGTEHRPLSVSERTVYGIDGTGSPARVIDEVLDNQETMQSLSGTTPVFFRAGTAYYDEVAVRIVGDLGLEVVGFDVLGDAGGTFTADQVSSALSAAEPGSIALLHMNQPAGGTAAGVRAAVANLRQAGFSFARVGDYDLE
jgi:peptidoglycan/xylan/chitin deacetylase (PgdA/CDA1 family)